MSETFWIDTNVILRFLTQDPPEQAEAATHLMEKADEGKITLYVHPLIIAECCYVLSSKYYGLPNKEIAKLLKDFLEAEGIGLKQKKWSLLALDCYEKNNVDFEDAYLAILSIEDSPKRLITFDKGDFKKLKAEYYQPQEVVSSLVE